MNNIIFCRLFLKVVWVWAKPNIDCRNKNEKMNKILACQHITHEKDRIFGKNGNLKMKDGKNIGRKVAIRADLGMEVMHERNAHNFPLDFA